MKQISKNLLREKSPFFLLLHLAVQVHVLNAYEWKHCRKYIILDKGGIFVSYANRRHYNLHAFYLVPGISCNVQHAFVTNTLQRLLRHMQLQSR
jgi:hypothetical protein